MPLRRRVPLVALPLLLGLGGCGYVHVGKLPEPATTVIGDDKLMKENSDLRLEKKILQQELALSRAQGDALRMTIENRAADGDTSRRLVEKLNETSRELAQLRASYAQLQSTRAAPAAGEAAALRTQLGETEEKLAASLRNFTQLQEEISRLRNEVAVTRNENLALTEQVKVITAKNEQVQAALAQLNQDLLAQKDARLRAEQDAQTLRSELKNVAPNSSLLAQQRTGAAADARSLVAEQAAETASLKHQLEVTQGKVDALTAERAELLQKLQTRTASPDLANLEAQLESSRRAEATLREENVQLKAARAELAQQLAAAKASPADAVGSDMREQLRQAQTQVASLTEENSRLKARLTQADATTRPEAVVVPAAITVAPNANGVIVRPSGVSATLVTSLPSTARPPAAKADASAGRVHVVASGDTLAKISNQYYGTTARWGDILAANRDVLGEGNNLVIGRTLRIP